MYEYDWVHNRWMNDLQKTKMEISSPNTHKNYDFSVWLKSQKHFVFFTAEAAITGKRETQHVASFHYHRGGHNSCFCSLGLLPIMHLLSCIVHICKGSCWLNTAREKSGMVSSHAHTYTHTSKELVTLVLALELELYRGGS